MLPSCVYITGNRPVIEPGRLIHRVTIRRRVDTGAVNAGGPVFGYTTVATPIVAIEAQGGREANEGGQTTTQLPMLIALWYQPGIRASDEVVTADDSIYRIQSIDDVLKARVVLVLACVALGANS